MQKAQRSESEAKATIAPIKRGSFDGHADETDDCRTDHAQQI
jgi:hypothetical protein